MSDEPAVFSAVYSDVKNVKTRDTVQFVFEVPSAAVDHALNVLGGWPKSGESKWFAIARLEPDKVKA